MSHLGQTKRSVFNYAISPAFGGLDHLFGQNVGHHFSRHAHEEYVIAIVQKGAERFTCSGAEHLASAGSAFFINPQSAHDGQPGTSEGWIGRTLYPHPDLIRKILGLKPGDDTPTFSNTVVNDSWLQQRMSTLFDLFERSNDPFLHEDCVSQVLHGIFSRYARFPRQSNDKFAPTRKLISAREIIDECATSKLSLDQVARKVGLNVTYFSTAFKQHFGITPSAYLISKRLHEVKRLLRNGKTISQSALASGFYDQSHLTRYFLKYVGITPGEFARAATSG